MSCVALAPTRAAKPGAAARHAEVALRYAWGETHGRVCAPHRLVIVNRVRELRLFLSHRYGDTLPDDDAGRDDLELLLNYVVQLNPGYGVPAMIAEARAWAPWLSCDRCPHPCQAHCRAATYQAQGGHHRQADRLYLC